MRIADTNKKIITIILIRHRWKTTTTTTNTSQSRMSPYHNGFSILNIQYELNMHTHTIIDDGHTRLDVAIRPQNLIFWPRFCQGIFYSEFEVLARCDICILYIRHAQTKFEIEIRVAVLSYVVRKCDLNKLELVGFRRIGCVNMYRCICVYNRRKIDTFSFVFHCDNIKLRQLSFVFIIIILIFCLTSDQGYRLSPNLVYSNILDGSSSKSDK